MLCRMFSIGVLIVSLSSVTIAQVVAFTTFDAGDVYDPTNAMSISGPSSGSPEQWAFQFTPTVGGELHSVRLAHAFISGDTELSVRLYVDSADEIGSPLNTWTFNDSTSTSHISTLANPVSAPTLSTGQHYWFEVFTTGNGRHEWSWSNGGEVTRSGVSTDGGQTYTYDVGQDRTAFEVLVVPEPTSILVLAGGALSLALRRRRRQARQN